MSSTTSTNSRRWNELKFLLQSAQMSYELLADAEQGPGHTRAVWQGKAHMALEVLLMMEHLEKDSGQGGFVDDVVVSNVGGTGLSSAADYVTRHGKDFTRNTDAT